MSSVLVKKGDMLALGAIPRAHLLPPEVKAFQKAQGGRRLLITGLVGMIVVAILAVGAASFGLFNTNAKLSTERARTASLTAEQGKYRSVVTMQNQVSDLASVQPIAATGEILWQPYVTSLQGTLPADTKITAFTAQLDDAKTSTVVSGPLQGTHIATVTITADSPKASISDWLDNLAKLPGFVDATPGSVVLVPASSRYTVSVALHVNADATANRFVEGKKK